MIAFNGQYLDEASHGNMRIIAACLGGQWVIAPWHIDAATQQAIIAAFGAEEGIAVIRRTNDYLNAIALTDQTRAQQISGFINEDPLLVTSLVETSKVRYCESSGMAYFFVDGVYGSDKLVTESKFAYLEGYTYPAVFGCASSGETYRYTIHSNSGGTNVAFRITGLSVNSITSPETWNEVKISKDGCYCNGTLLGKFTSIFKVANNMGVFLEHQDTIQTTRFANARIEYLKFADEDISVHLCPFTRNGESGMLDIISGTFYPNANTEGAFTIAITDKQ